MMQSRLLYNYVVHILNRQLNHLLLFLEQIIKMFVINKTAIPFAKFPILLN